MNTNEPKSEQAMPRACPFIPPVITGGNPLNPQMKTAHMQPCLGPVCQVWCDKRKDCGLKHPTN